MIDEIKLSLKSPSDPPAKPFSKQTLAELITTTRKERLDLHLKSGIKLLKATVNEYVQTGDFTSEIKKPREFYKLAVER